MRTYAAALVLGALAAAPAAAQSGRITSVYTNLDVARCTRTAHVDEGSSTTWRCRGHAGIPLIVMSGDDRIDIDAGVDNGNWESPMEFSAPPARVEWRLRGGRPFAIIYRLALSGEGRPVTSVLIVETVGRRGLPGCQIAEIDARVPGANTVARRHADARAARFSCGVDQVETEGPGR